MDEIAKEEADIIDRVLVLAKKNVRNSKEKTSQKDEAVTREDLINKLEP
jgi:hypothetical protein